MSHPVPGHSRRIYRAGTRRARIGCRCGRGAGQGRQTARRAGAGDRGDDWRRHRLQRHHAAADPALDRQPQGAGGLVGQAAAVPDRDRRPAQQPADRDHARQAHRLGIPVAQPDALPRQRRRELLGRRPPARGQRGRQLRRAHRRLRKQGHHLDLRRARHTRQQGQPAELPRRRAPAGRRHVPDRRHPQLPRADHRPQGQQDRHPVGRARQVPPRPAAGNWRTRTAPRRWTTATSWSARSPRPGSRASRARASCCGACARRTCAIRPTPSRRWTASRSSWPISASPAAW